jgi:hypothetical protein
MIGFSRWRRKAKFEDKRERPQKSGKISSKVIFAFPLPLNKEDRVSGDQYVRQRLY